MYNNMGSLKTNIKKYKDFASLLYEIISMKKENAPSSGILKERNEPLSHWMMSLEFKRESMMKVEKQQKKIYDSVKIIEDIVYGYL